jgi:Tol biopolymer transport system component
MVWRDGARETTLPVPPGRIGQVRLSPDGRKVAARVFDNGWHIWLYDVDRPTGTKVTNAGTNRNPMWSADGEWIYSASDEKGGLDVWRRRADLGGPAELVYGADGNQIPLGFTAEGRLVFITLDPGGSKIEHVDPSRPDVVKVLVDRQIDAPEAALTRDGRLLAYQAPIGGTWQIRILELSSGRQWTAEGGYNPTWSTDGSTLLYQQVGLVRLMSVSSAQGFSAGATTTLDTPAANPGCCDLIDRTRVLALKPVTIEQVASVIVNWPELVREKR